MVQIYDISQTLRPGIPVWPGDTAYAHSSTWQIGPDCPVNVSRLTLSSHTGTHADAPLHYGPDGTDSARSDLTPYIGTASVTDMSDRVTDILTLDMVQERIKTIAPRMLFKLFDTFPHDRWIDAFPAVAPDVIDYLAKHGCKLIGTDTPSLDPQASKTMQAHKAVERAGMAILEGLVLDHVPDGIYSLTALPLKIANADASPVRAVLTADT